MERRYLQQRLGPGVAFFDEYRAVQLTLVSTPRYLSRNVIEALQACNMSARESTLVGFERGPEAHSMAAGIACLIFDAVKAAHRRGEWRFLIVVPSDTLAPAVWGAETVIRDTEKLTAVLAADRDVSQEEREFACVLNDERTQIKLDFVTAPEAVIWEQCKTAANKGSTREIDLQPLGTLGIERVYQKAAYRVAEIPCVRKQFAGFSVNIRAQPPGRAQRMILAAVRASVTGAHNLATSLMQAAVADLTALSPKDAALPIFVEASPKLRCGVGESSLEQCAKHVVWQVYLRK